jgi:hypothetical protein
MAVADFTGFFAGFLVFAVCAGCGSSSFGVSANAIPDIRKSDNIIAAVFLIASLFLLQFNCEDTGESASLPAGKPRGSVLRARQSNVNIL